MSILTIAPATSEPADSNSYNAGYFDGELDALAKAPSALVHNRASKADAHDPLWAQGYIDGYLHQIEVTHALNEKAQAAR